ncbi:MAG: type II secretion system protein [Elusimicrobia bacterium]|nr:type II secretion system protein [Elusimicrobiota bacterium]
MSGARGYTLTELMVTVAITGTVSSVGWLVMQKSFQAQFMVDAQNEIQQGAFTSFDTLTRLLRPASASSIIIDRFDSSQPPWSRITFDIPSSGQTVSVYQKGQTLYFGSVPTFKGLRRITFSYPKSTDAALLSVSLTFEKGVGGGRSKAIQLYIQKIKVQN